MYAASRDAAQNIAPACNASVPACFLFLFTFWCVSSDLCFASLARHGKVKDAASRFPDCIKSPVPQSRCQCRAGARMGRHKETLQSLSICPSLKSARNHRGMPIDHSATPYSNPPWSTDQQHLAEALVLNWRLAAGGQSRFGGRFLVALRSVAPHVCRSVQGQLTLEVVMAVKGPVLVFLIANLRPV